MSLFDTYQEAAFRASETVFGDVATWGNQTANVLYNCPNNPINLGEADRYIYRPYNYSIEYFEDTFVGLKDSVDQGVIEHVTVKGNRLAIREVVVKYDGKTYVAFGELDEEI